MSASDPRWSPREVLGGAMTRWRPLAVTVTEARDSQAPKALPGSEDSGMGLLQKPIEILEVGFPPVWILEVAA